MRDTHATGHRRRCSPRAPRGTAWGTLRHRRITLPSRRGGGLQVPANLAPPLQILVDASNGASDYGNKFGEPLIAGYCRSFGQRLQERRAKGVDQAHHVQRRVRADRPPNLEKTEGDVGMLVVKIGGPAYRIGMGGGAASVQGGRARTRPTRTWTSTRCSAATRRCQTSSTASSRRASSSRATNPILSIHDQGAGGNCNVCKELIYPKGGDAGHSRGEARGRDAVACSRFGARSTRRTRAMLIAPESLAG